MPFENHLIFAILIPYSNVYRLACQHFFSPLQMAISCHINFCQNRKRGYRDLVYAQYAWQSRRRRRRRYASWVPGSTVYTYIRTVSPYHRADLCCRSFLGQDLFLNLNFFQRISRIFDWLICWKQPKVNQTCQNFQTAAAKILIK